MTSDVVVGTITLGDLYQRLHRNFTELGVTNALIGLVESHALTMSLETVSDFAKEALDEMLKRRWVSVESDGANYRKTPYGELYSKTGDIFDVVGNIASALGMGMLTLVITNDLGLGFLAICITGVLIVLLPVYEYYEDVPRLLKPWRIKTRLGFAVRVGGILGMVISLAYIVLKNI